MSSLKPFNMTFTEDDLRSIRSSAVPERLTPVIRTSTLPSRIATPPRTPPRLLTPAKIDTPPRTPPRVSTPPKQSFYQPRPSTIERRMQVNKILADEEREYERRKREKQQKDDENYLKEQLKLLEEQRKNKISQNKNLSNAKSGGDTQLFQKSSYKRFSNSRYYKWDSEDEDPHPHHHEHIPNDPQHEEQHCELCRRGLEQERRERERRLALLGTRSRSEHCRTIQRFVDEVGDSHK